MKGNFEMKWYLLHASSINSSLYGETAKDGLIKGVEEYRLVLKRKLIIVAIDLSNFFL